MLARQMQPLANGCAASPASSTEAVHLPHVITQTQAMPRGLGVAAAGLLGLPGLLASPCASGPRPRV